VDCSNKEVAQLFKALSDETRVAVLRMLISGEKCACVLLKEVDVGQPTLSHHMNILVESDIVRARRVGKWTYYSLNTNCCKFMAAIIEEFADSKDMVAVALDTRCCT
jgi:ArsR family transcriptional regulator, arsenate/arsenite/antimonite-responsive transcriptional repressor